MKLMKSLALIVFTDIAHDSRVKKQISLFQDKFTLTVFCMSGYSDALIRREYPSTEFVFLTIGRKTAGKNIFQYIERNILLPTYLLTILRNRYFDIIYANDFETLLPAYFCMRRKPSSLIYDTHEIWTERLGCKRTVFHRIINFAEGRMEKYIATKLRYIITVSDDIASFLENKWDYNGKIVTVRNIPSLVSSAEIPDVTNIKKYVDGNTVFVYAGLISRTRNTHNLIKAFSALEQQDIRLLLIGSSDFDIAEYSSGDSRIMLIGEVPETQLIHYLKLCDIGVHPLDTSVCLNHAYALPNKLFQYIHAGLALCFYYNSSIGSLINTYQNGICADMTSIEGISVQLNKILDMNIEQLKQNSLKAVKDLNWENESLKLTDIFITLS